LARPTPRGPIRIRSASIGWVAVAPYSVAAVRSTVPASPAASGGGAAVVLLVGAAVAGLLALRGG
jgi:hypothetical protein